MTDFKLPDLLSQGQPDLVLYDAGVDTHLTDRLGKLAIACVIGGGYAQDRKSLVYRHSLVHRAEARDLPSVSSLMPD